MEQVIIELTNVKQLASGEYDATLPNGKTVSGIAEGNKNLWPSLQAHLDAGKPVEPYIKPVLTYEELRAKEYPAVGDQLDAIWKQLNKDRLDGKDLISEADSLLGSVLAIKAKYPKDA